MIMHLLIGIAKRMKNVKEIQIFLKHIAMSN